MLRRCHLSAVMMIAAVIPASISLGSDLKPQSRIAIVRDLIAEYATLKVPLPRGKKGLLLKVDGGVEEQDLKHEITQNGTALPPNILIQITQIQFQNKEIILEINGGGKRKSKWYDHVELGVGGTTQPINQGVVTPPTGSSISLVFPQKIHDLTVEELKTYLTPVLDFTPISPMQAFSRPIPEKFRAAVEEKKAAVGMDRDTVLVALGPPSRKVRETKNGVEQEDWIYGAPPFKVTFVTFEEDAVVDIQEHMGGIGGQVQPSTAEPPR